MKRQDYIDHFKFKGRTKPERKDSSTIQALESLIAEAKNRTDYGGLPDSHVMSGGLTLGQRRTIKIGTCETTLAHARLAV